MSRKPTYSSLVNKVRELEKEIEVLTEKSFDIKKQKSLINNLVENSENFRLIADYTYDWEFWISPKGNYLYISPSM